MAATEIWSFDVIAHRDRRTFMLVSMRVILVDKITSRHIIPEKMDHLTHSIQKIKKYKMATTKLWTFLGRQCTHIERLPWVADTEGFVSDKSLDTGISVWVTYKPRGCRIVPGLEGGTNTDNFVMLVARETPNANLFILTQQTTKTCLISSHYSKLWGKET